MWLDESHCRSMPPACQLSFPTFAEREIRYEIYYQLSNYNLVALPYQSWQKYRELEAFKKTFTESKAVTCALFKS
jgi:hypothetical protein